METNVPLGEKTVPFIRVFDEHERFEATVRKRAEVKDIHAVSSNGEEVLYTLDWDGSDDEFFKGIRQHDGTIIHSRGTEGVWEFEVRFSSHDALSAFEEHCHHE